VSGKATRASRPPEWRGGAGSPNRRERPGTAGVRNGHAGALVLAAEGRARVPLGAVLDLFSTQVHVDLALLPAHAFRPCASSSSRSPGFHVCSTAPSGRRLELLLQALHVEILVELLDLPLGVEESIGRSTCRRERRMRAPTPRRHTCGVPPPRVTRRFYTRCVLRIPRVARSSPIAEVVPRVPASASNGWHAPCLVPR